jgi:hypothetical protein
MNAPANIGHIRVFEDMVQGSGHWLAARCGLLTASEMKLIITPTFKIASNDKERAHLFELLGQRITQYVEPRYVSDDMLRGQSDEILARELYSKNYAPVTEVGFIVNTSFGFPIGYSPDGLVGDDGLIEAKSRRAKYQVQMIVENLGVDQGETIPADFVIQCQTGLLVTERKWLDFISYSGGLPMAVVRVHPDEKVQNAIVEAAGDFERRIAEKWEIYRQASLGLVPTERTVEQEMHL